MAELPDYDEYRNSVDEDMRLKVGNMVDVEADRAVRILNLRGRTGLPEKAIDMNLDFIEEQANRNDFDPEAYRDTPHWKRFAADNPYNLAVLKEDAENLNRFERSWDAIANSWRKSYADQERAHIGKLQWESGVSTPEQEERLKELEVWDVDHDFNSTIEAKLFVWMGKQGANLVGAFESGARRASYTAPAGALIGGYMAAPAAPVSFGTSIGAGAVAGYGTGATIGFTIGAAEYAFEHETGGAYLEYRGLGFTHEEAYAAAGMVGSINAVLEAGGAGRIIKKLPGVERVTGLLGDRITRNIWGRPTYRQAFQEFAKQTSTTMAFEVSTEIGQEITTMAAGEILKDVHSKGGPRMTREEFVGRIGDIAVETMKSTLLLAGSGPAINFYADSRRAHDAKQRELAWTAAAEASKGSDMRTKAPAKYKEFVDSISEGDTVLIDAEAYDTYWQSNGFDPDEKAKELGIDAEELAEARINGDEISIPLSEWATQIAPTSHYAGLAPDIKTNRDQMSAREADQFYERRDKFMEEFEKLAEELGDTTDYGARDNIINDIIGQLIGARYQPNAARMTAQFFQGIPNLAERAGLDPQEFYDEVFGGIKRVQGAAVDPRLDLDMQVDPLIDSLREGDIPTQREIRGQSLLEFIREKGGIMEEGGELAARDFGKVTQPGLLNNVSGLSFDGVAELAAEAGYIKDYDQGQLLEAIDRELQGDKVYGSDFAGDPEVEQRAERLEQLAELVELADLDLTNMTNAEVRAALEAYDTYNQLEDMDLGELGEFLAALADTKDATMNQTLMSDIMRLMPQITEDQNFAGIQFSDTVRHQRTGQLVKVTRSADTLYRRAVKRRNMVRKLLDCVSG